MKRNWIIIAIIVVIAVIAGVVFGRMMPRQITPNDLANYTEPDKYVLTGKVVISPDIEGAKLLDVTYEVDKGWLNQDTLVFKWIELKNNSANYIEGASISLEIFDGKGKELRKEQSGYIEIGPGKTGSTRFGVQFKDLSATPKSFTLTLESVTWRRTAPSTSTTPPIIAKESPSQIAEAVLTAIIKDNYDGIQKYFLTPSYSWAEEVKKYEKQIGGKIVRFVIFNEEIGGDLAKVEYELYLDTGKTLKEEMNMFLINGEWRFP